MFEFYRALGIVIEAQWSIDLWWFGPGSMPGSVTFFFNNQGSISRNLNVIMLLFFMLIKYHQQLEIINLLNFKKPLLGAELSGFKLKSCYTVYISYSCLGRFKIWLLTFPSHKEHFQLLIRAEWKYYCRCRFFRIFFGLKV